MNSCYNDDIGASFLILQLPWVTQNTHLHTQLPLESFQARLEKLAFCI